MSESIASAADAVNLELLVARFYAYKLFHVMLSAEPTDEVLDALLSDDALEAAAVLAEGGYDTSALVEAVSALRDRRATDPEAFLSEAHKAFNKLFLVPGEGSVKLYESVYAGQMNTIFGPTTIDVRKYLRASGLASDATGNFPEDYLPLMLDFMGTLAGRTCEAAGNEVDAAADRADEAAVEQAAEAVSASLRVQRDFAVDHLGHWISQVVAALDAHDSSRIYFAFGQAMVQFIESDRRWLEAMAN